MPVRDAFSVYLRLLNDYLNFYSICDVLDYSL